MKKILRVIARKYIITSLLVLGLNISQSLTICQQPDFNQNKIRTVVLDAGHGGKDPGAIGLKSKEKDIVLAITLLVGKYINEYLPDVNVVYTRDTDTLPPLHERARIANEAKADLFISIHANSNKKTSAYGTETWVMGLHKSEENLEVAKKENSVITYEENYHAKYEGFDPNDIESYIMMSLMQDIYLDQSLSVASLVQNQFRDRVNRKDRGVKQAGFLVLWQTSMPSILIETGFISNPHEEEFLISKQGQEYLASAIFRAFRDYKQQIEGTSSEILMTSNSAPKDETNKPEITEKPVNANNIIEDPKKEENSKKPEEITKQVVESEKQAINEITEEGGKKDAVFKVQILFSENKLALDNAIFKDFNDVEEIEIEGKFKYLVGSSNSYSEVTEYSKWVKSRYPDAFIVAVSNGKIVPLTQVLSNKSN
ncbi:MAG: N-acetylmuramoyl-L-alanine amidase [Bacteroidales bacterium]|nr:N-acetylmuramoyl-L-alanine amidase [Bacteroidales bacterium]MBN2818568.1 N-acetylmuramoyl-L-alanine amidase [Bacteroidales bacterium]